MKHAWKDAWEPVKGLGLVQVCSTCGVMRKMVKGVLHYYTKAEHKGTGLHDSCPVRDFVPSGVQAAPVSARVVCGDCRREVDTFPCPYCNSAGVDSSRGGEHG